MFSPQYQYPYYQPGNRFFMMLWSIPHALLTCLSMVLMIGAAAYLLPEGAEMLRQLAHGSGHDDFLYKIAKICDVLGEKAKFVLDKLMIIMDKLFKLLDKI